MFGMRHRSRWKITGRSDLPPPRSSPGTRAPKTVSLGDMRPLVCSLAAAFALLAPSVARADRVQGTRSEKLLEQTHWAALRLDGGHAELVVRRTVHNGGPRFDQAMM